GLRRVLGGRLLAIDAGGFLRLGLEPGHRPLVAAEEMQHENRELIGGLRDSGLRDVLADVLVGRPRGLARERNAARLDAGLGRPREAAQLVVDLGERPEGLLDALDEIEFAANKVQIAADLEARVVGGVLDHQNVVRATGPVMATIEVKSMRPSTSPG